MISHFHQVIKAVWSIQNRGRISLGTAAAAVGLLVLVLVSSCFIPTGSGKETPGATVKVILMISELWGDTWDEEVYEDKTTSRLDYGSINKSEGTRALLHNPAPLPDDLRILIMGKGPGDALLAEVPVNGFMLELDLVAGAWSFQARAVDGEGLTFLAGSTAATVHPSTGAQVSIQLSPIPGSGSLAVSYIASASLSETAAWRCFLSDKAGSILASWIDPVTVTARTLPEIPSGYYLLTACLQDGELDLAGRTDVVRIIAGRSTLVPLILDLPLAGVELQLGLDYRQPLAITASLLSRNGIRGLPLRVRATAPLVNPLGSVSGLPLGMDIRWSARGTALARGELVDIPTQELPRLGVIDLVAFFGFSAGAADLAYSLIEPTVKEGWCLYATVGLPEEPSSQALVKPAMVAASRGGVQPGSPLGSGLASGAYGTVLAVASDGASSKLELWRPDPYSGELTPGAFATLRIGGSPRKATLVAISGDGSYVGAASSESNWIWLAPIDSGGYFGPPVELLGGSSGLPTLGYVRGLAFSPTADRLYALSNSDRSIYVFHRTEADWSLLQRFILDNQPCGTLSVLRALALSPDGSRLAVAAASSDAVVILDVVEAGLSWRTEARRTAGFPDIDYPQTLAFHPGGSSDGWPEGPYPAGRLAVGCKDSGALVILDIEAVPPATITVLKATDGLPGIPVALSWSEDARFLAVSSPDAAALIRLDTEGQSLGMATFTAADAPGLASPAGLAMVCNSLYLASPETQSLVILSRLQE